MKQPKSVKDIAKNPGEPLAQIVPTEQVPLPPPFDDFNEEPKYAEISDEAREKYESDLDDTMVLSIPKPKDARRRRPSSRSSSPAWRSCSRRTTTGPSSSR
jgi:hypothetical protein